MKKLIMIFTILSVFMIPNIVLSATTYHSLKSTDSPLFATIDLSGVTDGYFPYNSASGLTTSPMFTDGTNVGIGTTSPDAELDLNTGSLITEGTITIRENDDGNNAVYISRDADEGYVRVYSNGVLKTELRGNGDNYITSGNVGIGTASPDTFLHVNAGSAGVVSGHSTTRLLVEDDTAASIGILTPNNQTAYYMIGDVDDNYVAGISYDHSTDKMSIFSNNAVRMTIDSSGDVGIGTESSDPETTLEVRENHSTTYSSTGLSWSIANDVLFLNNEDTSADYTSMYFRVRGTLAPSGRIALERTANYNGDFTFSLRNSGAISYAQEKMRITSAGNVGIGTTSPQAELHIGQIHNPTILLSDTDYGDTSTDGFKIEQYNANAYLVNQENGSIFFGTNATNRGEFRNNGDLKVYNLAGTSSRAVLTDSSGNVYPDTSDITLKKDVQNIPYGLEEIEELRPVKFNWKDIERHGTKPDIGFIAQEVELIIPEIVAMNYDGKKSVNYRLITAVLTKAIQEQQALIEDLTSRIETLEGGN
jgi:hypothetical protein